MLTHPASIVGVDIAKDKADVCVQDKTWTVSLDQLPVLVEQLKAIAPQWIVLEPTGGYEMPWVDAFLSAGLRVARPHVGRVSHHARGRHTAKTDPLDARALAHYGACYAEQLRPFSPDAGQESLRALYQRRRQLVDMRTQEKNRSQQTLDTLRESTQAVIDCLNRQIEMIETELAERIEADPSWQRKQALLTSMTGVGPTAAMGLIALLPELGEANRKEIAAMVGVAPMARSSGKFKGRACIQGGRFAVRQLLYMATLSAIRYCPVIRQRFQNLKARGKAGKQAVVACIHQMLRILNTMLKNNQPFRNPS